MSVTLDTLVDRSQELFTLPRVAMQVLELTRQPTVNAWHLKQCIEIDPALTAKLLRVVNSPLFGLTRSVADLSQALAILGTKPLKLLVLGFSLPEGLFHNVGREALSRYWRRTLIKAVAARELAPHLPRVSEDEAFIAALLQDIGSLVLLQHLGSEYLLLLETAEATGNDERALERLTLGFDHTELSARLLEHWQLPEAIVAAARMPDLPGEEGCESRRQPPLRQVVYLADLLAHVLLSPRPDTLQKLLSGIHGLTTLNETQLAKLTKNLSTKVSQLADVLSLEPADGLDCEELLSQAYAQLGPIAASAAAELVSARRQLALEQAEEWSHSEASQGLRRKIASRAMPSPTPVAAGEWEAATTVMEEESPAIDERLLRRLTAAIAECRQRRAPLSLLMVQLDRSEMLAESVVARLSTWCKSLEHAELSCHWLSESCLAVTLPDCDRPQAVRLAQQLLNSWRRLSEASSTAPWSGSSLSLGLAALALAPRNFAPQDLISRAARCLSGARSSGGNCLKSIEL